MAGIFTPRPGTGKLPVTGKLGGTGKLPPKPPVPQRPQSKPLPRPLPGNPVKLPVSASQLKDLGKNLFNQTGSVLNSVFNQKTKKKGGDSGGTVRVQKSMMVMSAESGGTNSGPVTKTPIKPPKKRGPRTDGAQGV